MANWISFPNGFRISSTMAIDKRLILSKDEMKNLKYSDGKTIPVPTQYLAICSDDGNLYVYNDTNTANSETGKYKLANIDDIVSRINEIKALIPTEYIKDAQVNNNKLTLIRFDDTTITFEIDVTKNYVDTELLKKQDLISKENKLKAELIDGLSAVATSGSYNDLSDKPAIPSIEGLATVEQVTQATLNMATTGYVDIKVANMATIDDVSAATANMATVSYVDEAIAGLTNTYATISYVNTEIAKKQNTINDLETIRSGAALGATALQSVPDDYAKKTYVDEHHDDTKQDVISDLESIRSNASEGAQKSKVSWIQSVTTGTKIATINIDGTDTEVYAPEGGSSGNSVQTSTINGNILIDNVESVVYRLPEAYEEYLENITYQKPTIASFAVENAGTYEIGSTVTVESLNHYETNINNIVGSLTLKKGSDILASNVTCSTVTRSFAFTPQQLTSTTQFTLSGVDTKNNNFSKSSSIIFNTYVYYAVTSTTDTPTSWTKASTNGQNAEITLSYTAGQYLWLAYEATGATATNIQVYNALSKSWSDIGTGTTKSQTPIEMTLQSGATVNYYTYRSTTGMAATGTNMKFRLN